MCCESLLREQGLFLFSLEKKEFHEHLTTGIHEEVIEKVKPGSSQQQVVEGWETMGMSWNMNFYKKDSDYKKNFYLMGVIGAVGQVPTESIEYLFLGVFKFQLDRAFEQTGLP